MKLQLDKIKALFKPLELSGCELLVMRILFALVVWQVMPGKLNLHEQAAPVGMAKWFGIDFTFFSDPATLGALRITLLVSLVLYCSGRFLYVALPVMLFLVAGAGTLINSQKAATHSTQIVALCVLAQCAWHIYAAIANRKSAKAPGARRLEEGRLGIWYTQQMVAAAYVVSAVTKWMAKGNWVADSHNFPLQIVKSQRMDYYNRLQETGESSGNYGPISDALAPVASWLEKTMMTSPQWAPLLLAPGFLLELFAFILLAGRKTGAIYALLLIVFHLTIAEMMELNFKYHVFVLAIFFSGAAYWIARPIQLGAAKWLGRPTGS
jgi:hypothetical protein